MAGNRPTMSGRHVIKTKRKQNTANKQKFID